MTRFIRCNFSVSSSLCPLWLPPNCLHTSSFPFTPALIYSVCLRLIAALDVNNWYYIFHSPLIVFCKTIKEIIFPFLFGLRYSEIVFLNVCKLWEKFCKLHTTSKKKNVCPDVKKWDRHTGCTTRVLQLFINARFFSRQCCWWKYDARSFRNTTTWLLKFNFDCANVPATYLKISILVLTTMWLKYYITTEVKDLKYKVLELL